MQSFSGKPLFLHMRNGSRSGLRGRKQAYLLISLSPAALLRANIQNKLHLSHYLAVAAKARRNSVDSFNLINIKTADIRVVTLSLKQWL